jgi:DNA-binding NarL/FixJ family response regulator
MQIEGKLELQQTTVRVLVVDDLDLWHTFVHMRLHQEPNIHVIAVAADGLEAVQKAEELRPDLILLDIDLPKLNGIEAARRISRLVPQSKILFLSSNADPDVVRSAFNAGGLGYIQKSEAARELLKGMETVLLGERFLGCRSMRLEDLI